MAMNDILFSRFKSPIRNKYPDRQVELRAIYDTIYGDTYKEKTANLRSIANQDEAKIQSLEF